jgi:DHA1 family tetracycline resistance protein-like MFS transporter
MKTIVVGMCLWMVGLFLFSTAFEGWMMYAFLLPYCLGGVATPTLQGLISNQVPENEQGELQGAMTSLISLSAIIGQPVMTYLFYVFSKEDNPVYYPGAAFFAAGILVIISLLLVLKPLRKLTTKAS